MTCDECRDKLRIDPTKVTRGERSEVMTHVLSCFPCLLYLRVLSAISRVPPEEKIGRIRALTRDDMKDPEYVSEYPRE